MIPFTKNARDNTDAPVGSWTSLSAFRIDREIIGYSTRDRWNLTFDEDEILVEETGVTGEYRYARKAVSDETKETTAAKGILNMQR